MKQALISILKNLMQQDPELMLLTGDLGYGLFDDLPELFPKQYLNMGVAEQNMIGVATGLALEGKSIFTYSIANFATLRCLEQIRNDACYHDVNVNIVAFGGGFTYGSHGMSHHATEDLAIMQALPNVTVLAPATKEQVEYSISSLYNSSGVGYLRLEKISDAQILPTVNKDIFSINYFGSEQAKIVMVAIGGISVEAYKALQKLQKGDLSIGLINIVSLKPLDTDGIVEKLKFAKIIITIEEHNVIGGLGSRIADLCLTHNVRPEKFIKLGVNDEYTSVVGKQDYLREFYQIDCDALLKEVLSIGKLLS